jgi:hypothetical protein
MWQISDIYETTAIVSIYTMIFVSILALVMLYRDQVTQRKVQQ